MPRTHVSPNAETLAVLEGPALTAPPLRPAATRRPGFTQPPGLALYCAEVLRVPHPTPAEERRLVARMRHGDRDALDEMAIRHLGLVIEIIEERRRPAADPFELLEVGNLSLLSALKAFDPEVEPDLHAFIRFCVTSAVDRAVCA